MIITIALFAIFTIAAGLSVLVLADAVIRGRTAYRELSSGASNVGTAATKPVMRSAVRSHRAIRQPATRLALAA